MKKNKQKRNAHIVLVTDIMDNVVNTGSVIAYPGRHGGDVWMNVGTVMGIGGTRTYPTLLVKRHEGAQRIVTLTNLDNLVILHKEFPII